MFVTLKRDKLFELIYNKVVSEVEANLRTAVNSWVTTIGSGDGRLSWRRKRQVDGYGAAEAEASRITLSVASFTKSVNGLEVTLNITLAPPYASWPDTGDGAVTNTVTLTVKAPGLPLYV